MQSVWPSNYIFIQYTGSIIPSVIFRNWYNLSSDVLEDMEAIYDRAALVALPSAIQQKYSKHLIEITKTAPQLLLTVEHNQTQKITPPFSTT